MNFPRSAATRRRPRPAPALSQRPAARPARPGAGDAGARTPAAPWVVALGALSLLVNILYGRYLFADSYYDLYAGRYVLRHGIPHSNVVTVVSRGAPWIDQQWLAHVIYYGAWAAGGYPAVAVLSALLVTSAFVVLALLMLGRGIPPTRAFAWTAAAIIPYLGNIMIRAQSFAYLCFALTLWLIVTDCRAPRPRGGGRGEWKGGGEAVARGGGRGEWNGGGEAVAPVGERGARIWLAIPVLVFWANTHGSVLIGAALVALYAGYRAVAGILRGDRWPVLRYLALAAAAAASVLCTPYGTGVIGYYERVNGVTPALSRYVTEWERPSPLYLVSMGFFALLVACVIAVAVAWRRGTRPDPVLAAIALAVLGLALTAIRNQAFFGFAGSLLAADTLARSNAGRAPVLSRAFSRAVAAALAAAALIAVGVVATSPDSKFESLVPVRAIGVAAALAARSPGARVLADEWSSPPMLWLHPEMFGRVAYDARLEQYSVAQLNAYARFLSARAAGWQRLMRGYDLVVASRRNHQWLARALARLAGWRVAYSGRDGLVLQRG